MTYRIAVRNDDIEKNCFMVVITDVDGKVHGIPLRGVSKREATEMLQPLKFAFGYGAAAALESIRGAISYSEVEIKEVR